MEGWGCPAGDTGEQDPQDWCSVELLRTMGSSEVALKPRGWATARRREQIVEQSRAPDARRWPRA